MAIATITKGNKLVKMALNILGKVLRISNPEIIIINKSKIDVLPELFLSITPKIDIKGRLIINETKKNFVFVMVGVSFESEIRLEKYLVRALEKSLFKKRSIIYNNNKTTFIVLIRGRGDRGSEIPKRGYNSFINNPVNIKNAILNPTENNRVSATLKPRSLKMLSIIIPGTKVR